MAGDATENSTIQAELCSVAPSLPFLELHGRGTYGLRRVPFLHNPLHFELQAAGDFPAHWSVELTPESELLFHCSAGLLPSRKCLLNEVVELGGERWVVVDVRMLPPYRLVSMSAALHYRAWPLGEGQWLVGRPGRRHNDIVLEATSISRAHALLEIDQGSVRLVAEAEGALTAVNGERLGPGQSRELRPNDVLQLGDLLFRWEREETSAQLPESRLRVRLLGGCAVSLASAPEVELPFRNENAFSLLTWLIVLRGRALPTERVLEEYWPERPELRQRKNLSHTLRALQTELGWTDVAYDRLLDRRSETLALRVEAVQDCDVWVLHEALRQPGPPLPLARVLELHPGALLPRARQGWVRTLRDELFLGWLELLGATVPEEGSRARLSAILTACLREGDFPECVYAKVFEVASGLGLAYLIPIWLGELRDTLRASIGDEPSPELVELSAHWTKM